MSGPIRLALILMASLLFWGLLILTLVAAIAVMSADARAHGWFTDAKDPETGLGCCDGDDCDDIPDESVQKVDGGFQYLPTGEFIPYSRVLQSKTWGFARCVYQTEFFYLGVLHREGETRCFFAPPGAM